MIGKITPELINQQSEKLMSEFQEHWREVSASEGTEVPKHEALGGFVIQKLASLQLMVAAAHGVDPVEYVAGLE